MDVKMLARFLGLNVAEARALVRSTGIEHDPRPDPPAGNGDASVPHDPGLPGSPQDQADANSAEDRGDEERPTDNGDSEPDGIR
jgi:hypothetical protein